MIRYSYGNATLFEIAWLIVAVIGIIYAYRYICNATRFKDWLIANDINSSILLGAIKRRVTGCAIATILMINAFAALIGMFSPPNQTQTHGFTILRAAVITLFIGQELILVWLMRYLDKVADKQKEIELANLHRMRELERGQ